MNLNAATRERIPLSEFGLPKLRKYPVDTRRRAGLAKGYAQKQYANGNLSLAELGAIRSKANRRLQRGRLAGSP